MFDIGFWELCLVGLVALLVLGPERLPKAARVTGLWLAKANRLVASVKQEIKEELHAEEVRQELLAQQASVDEFRGALKDAGESITALDESVRGAIEDPRQPAASSRQPESHDEKEK